MASSWLSFRCKIIYFQANILKQTRKFSSFWLGWIQQSEFWDMERLEFSGFAVTFLHQKTAKGWSLMEIRDIWWQQIYFRNSDMIFHYQKQILKHIRSVIVLLYCASESCSFFFWPYFRILFSDIIYQAYSSFYVATYT